ncbi:hypothetical protein, variant 1 [Aphanomyces invadans]|uniref:PDZ domain-containing protein n=1 Tax=Aphanomyces invadans TaxID=157072 RepID=A0A024TIY1_9STRA|nr:hypothetical protein, variant 1 [Aphanomyces invadans]ETV94008.1 hypothetical protein, variant 1 [Aphanomyces invadans]|eukprot:XP_008877210.1 hypothetical protein, variant 1 [Aphanomyces invadans]
MCRWKIHRRYRHFDLLLSRLIELSSVSSARWPSLSGSYLQMFRAKHCKDRLVELHSWLVKALEMLQSLSPSIEASDTVATQFTCFLFAAANVPYVTFPSLPLFAWAHEQVYVRLTSNVPALYPSRVQNQLAADSSRLGLRLTPSTSCIDDASVTIYRGAVVSGVLRDSFDVPNVQYVRVGSHLSHINGIPVDNEAFDTILLHLRNLARPMHLTFTYDRRPQSVDRPLSESDLRRHDRLQSSAGSTCSGRKTSASSMGGATELQTPLNVLGSVLTDTFGSRKRTETLISITSDENNQDDDEILCWDDIPGLVMDSTTSGFYFALPAPTPPAHEATGIWSTSAGPLKMILAGCNLRGKQAVFLAVTPQAFGPWRGSAQSSSRRGKKQPPEVRLERGMVLVSVNGTSTFDLTFHESIDLIGRASIPTALCFRWFHDYSLFLHPNSDHAMPMIYRPTSAPPSAVTEAEIACFVEAQTKLSGLLHQALTENASLRLELQVVQESNRHLRDDHSAASRVHTTTAQDTDRLIRRCNQLQAALGAERVQVQQTAKELRKAEQSVRDVERRFEKKLAHAHVLANQRAKAHEQRCIEESRKSIEAAKRAAEARTKRQVDEALAAQRRQNNLDMQRLAEDNGEEIEFLNQQLALWKHQVEVLTENDKRKQRSTAIGSLAPKTSEDEDLLDGRDRRRQSISLDDREGGASESQSFWGRVFEPVNCDEA